MRRILAVGRNSNIKTGWELYMKGDMTEGKIYKNPSIRGLENVGFENPRQ